MRKMLVSEVFDRHGIKRCPFRSSSGSLRSAKAGGVTLRTLLARPSADLRRQNALSARAALTSCSATYAMGSEWDGCPSMAAISTLQPCSGRVFFRVNSRLTNSGHFAVVAGENGVSPTTFLFFSFLFFRGFIPLKHHVFEI